MPRRATNIDEKIEKLDAVIAYHKNAIAKAEAKKDALTNPPKKISSRDLMEAIKAAGLTPEEALKKLKK